jgi:predicted transcriptional regulator
MSVPELQKKIIEKIIETNDAAFLEDIYNFIGIEEGLGTFYHLSDAQLAAIEESQQQIKDGNYFTNEEVNKEIDEWLGK